MASPAPTYTKRHGYVFEIPANATGPVHAVPITGMGRFSHEATATDPRTGIVYETEDTGDSLFYRYAPNVKGSLLEGGTLQALKLKDFPNANTGVDFLDKKGLPLACEWVTIDNPDPLDNVLANSTRGQGQAKGAARFVRGEGAWYGNDLAYFCCTGGGNLRAGQIWAYDPAARTLTPIVESESRDELDAPDNITVGPGVKLIN